MLIQIFPLVLKTTPTLFCRVNDAQWIGCIPLGNSDQVMSDFLDAKIAQFLPKKTH